MRETTSKDDKLLITLKKINEINVNKMADNHEFVANRIKRKLRFSLDETSEKNDEKMYF